MTYDSKNWKHWGEVITALLSWALKPGLIIIFIILNWEYFIPVTGVLFISVVEILSGDNYLTDVDIGDLLFIMGQFFGTVLLTVLCYYTFDGLLRRVPFFTYEGEKERRAQEEANRRKFDEVRRNTLTLDTLVLYKTERDKDRRLIAEMRESFRNLKLEVEALRESKPNISDKSVSKDASLDLFKKKKSPASKRAPKRFVPRASFKKQTPEF